MSRPVVNADDCGGVARRAASRRRIVWAGAVLGLLLLLGWLTLGGGEPKAGEGGTGVEGAQARWDVLRMGYAVEAPYAMVGENGEAAGVMPELALRVARRLGVKRVEWRLTEFGRLLDELDEGVFDVVAAGLFVTEEREARCVFAEPIFLARGGLLVASGNPLGLTDYEAIARRASVRVAVLAGAVEGPALRLAGVESERLVELPDAISLWALWKAGRVEAAAFSIPTLKWLLREEAPGVGEIVPMAGDQALDGRVAFAFRRGEAALARAWTAAQAEEMRVAGFGAWARRHGLEPRVEGEQ